MNLKRASRTRRDRRKPRHDAPGVQYGFSVQTSRLLAYLLRAERGQAVSLEYIDDVAVEAQKGVTAEQIKSGLAHNPVADRSVGLWKTLRNWIEAIRAGALKHRVSFVLYVAQPHTGDVVSAMSAVTTVEGALALIAHLRELFWGAAPDYKDKASLPEGLAKYVNVVLEARDEILTEMIINFRLEQGSGSPNDDLIPLLRNKAISETNLELILQKLLGWLKRRTDKSIEQGLPAVITWEVFNKELTACAQKFDRPGGFLPATEADISPSDIEREIRERTYIRQLQLIDAQEDVLVTAVNEFLRAAADRTNWSERGDVHESSFQEFQTELKRAWENHRNLAAVEFAGRPEIDIGKLLFGRCMGLSVRLQGMDVPSHFGPGSYHALADELVVGWHPSYRLRLQSRGLISELPATEAGDSNKPGPSSEGSGTL
jgi:hypothetical protein